MQLSPHFSYEELTFSQVASRFGYNNTPDAECLSNLTRLAAKLEEARDILGVPIHVDSGYRSLLVNHVVGGATGSAHMAGRAADIVPQGIDLRNAFDALRTNLKGFDQIIIECSAWIHLAIAATYEMPRGEALAASGRPGSWVYTKVA